MFCTTSRVDTTRHSCRSAACQARWNACQERELRVVENTGNATSEALAKAEESILKTCVPVLAVDELERDLSDACRMTTGIFWQGAAVWRWLLFALMFWPVDLVGHLIARILVAVGMVMISFNVWQGSVRCRLSLTFLLGTLSPCYLSCLCAQISQTYLFLCITLAALVHLRSTLSPKESIM